MIFAAFFVARNYYYSAKKVISGIYFTFKSNAISSNSSSLDFIFQLNFLGSDFFKKNLRLKGIKCHAERT